MTKTRIRLLLVEDNETDVMIAREELSDALDVRFDILLVDRLQLALQHLAQETFDVVVLDLSLPDSDGLDTFKHLRAAAPHVPVVVVSHRLDEGIALQAVQLGAQEYMVKGQMEAQLVRTIRHAIERAVVQSKLRNSEGRFAGVIASATDAIICTDHQQHIIVFNQAAEKMFGYRAEEMQGQGLDKLIPQEFRMSYQSYIESFLAASASTMAMEGGTPLNAIRANGNSFPIEASISKVMVDGQALFTIIVRDVTERILMSEEINQHRHNLESLVELRTVELEIARQQADAGSKAKSIFLANMSHEIRTPMAAILGFAQMIKRDGATEQLADRLAKIEYAGQHLLTIINDILDLSKIEAGRFELEGSNFQLGSVLDGVLSILGQKASEKGLLLKTDCAIASMWVRGDPMRLRQALLNYGGNAIKFTQEGKILLSVEELESNAESLLLRFEVRDTGPGIAPEALARLFQSFEQADSSISRNYGGTGLGLVITQHLAQLMGGKAGAHSSLGTGSTFWFTARLQQALAPAIESVDLTVQEAEAQLRREHTGARILLVEDDLFNQEIALDLLGDLGLAVEVADNGKLALELMQANHYDLILMDLQMPVMDGLTATRAIRALSIGKAIPILAMTANAFSEDVARTRDAGMNDFIAKPIVLLQMLSKLNQWLPKKSKYAERASYIEQ